MVFGIVPFIFILNFKKVPKKYFLTLFGVLLIITIAYFSIYFQQTAHIERNTIQGSQLSINNIKNVIIGIIQSSLAPFANLYKILRTDSSWSKPMALFICIIPIIVFGLITISKKGQEFIKTNFRNVILSFLGLIFINGMLLAPYILNDYFEPRMMVVTFALGSLFWAYWLAKLLQLISFQKFELSYLSIGIVLIFVGFSIGAPISNDIKHQYAYAQKMVKIAQDFDNRGIDKVRLIHFPSRGSYLRGGNAKGIFDYISKRRIQVDDLEEIVLEDLPKVDYPTIFYTGDPQNPFEIAY